MAIQLQPFFLMSSQLGFRRWTTDDLPLALALWGDVEVTRFIGGPFSTDEVRARLQREIENDESFGVQYWPIFSLNNTEFVGCCGFRPRDTACRVFELGFQLSKSFWGRGLAYEAAEKVIRFGLQDLNMSGIIAGHHPQNIGSKKILDRLGFRYTHDELYPPTGIMEPCYIYERSSLNREADRC